MGRIPWNKGKKQTEEHKRNISLSLLGHTISKETRRKISIANKGNKNILNFTKEQREKANKNLKSYNEFPEEIKAKIRKGWFEKGHKRGPRGKNHHRYNPNTIHEYTNDFKEIRNIIKKRDNFECNLCDSNNNLVVHHKNCDKYNNNEDNLITLCRSCHMLLHSNEGMI